MEEVDGNSNSLRLGLRSLKNEIPQTGKIGKVVSSKMKKRRGGKRNER